MAITPPFRPATRIAGPTGRCAGVFEWDRPLDATTVIRYRSTTGPIPDQPDQFISFTLDRRVIPLAQPPTDGRAPPPPMVSAVPLAPPKPR